MTQDYRHHRAASPGMNLGRRQVLVGTMATGAAAALGVAPGSSLWTPAMAAQPKAGGHLRAGLSGGATSDTLDPRSFTGTFMVCLSRTIRDSLIDIVEDNKLAPALATHWEANADASQWRFELRKGVEFSNGKPFTADDAIASLNAHRGEDTKSAVKGLLEPVQSIEKAGSHTMVITLDAGNADFPYMLTENHMPMMPSQDGVADLTTPVGTGLYKLESFEPGVRARFTRNPNAWQQNELGFVDEITFVSMSDATSRQSALMAGDVDAIDRPDMKTIDRLDRVPDVRVVSVNSTKHYTMPMRVNVAPFDEVNVRRALKHAIKRDEFVSTVLNGYGTVGNDHPIGPGFRYHDPSIPQNEYDPDKARHFLKKAGHDSLNVDFHVANAAFPSAVDSAVLFKESAAKAGIEINVVREPDDGYWSNVWNKKPFCASFWGARPVEDMILSATYLSTAPRNESKFGTDKLDRLIKDARSELDEDRRQDMYSEIQRILNKDGGRIIPAFAQDVMAMRDYVGTDGQYGGGWVMDGGHFAKRWWLK